MQTHHTGFDVPSVPLLVAFELGQQWWKIGTTTGIGQRPRMRRIAAGNVAALQTELTRARVSLRLPADAPVVSCYEAGRDGFWLHRFLVAHGITNYVVDSASIEVNRRARRIKTDAVDLSGLLNLLARYVGGDRRCWRVVRVPRMVDEDARHLHRTWETLQQDRTRVVNRLKALLATLGVRLSIGPDCEAQIDDTRLWDGTPIPAGARRRLAQDLTQLRALEAHLHEVRTERTALPVDATTTTGRYAATLQTVRAIGPIGSWVLATEVFGWREIRNGRELGALVGLAPALYQSGEMRREQGITRAGNAHVRRVMVQLAWTWVRYQSSSALTLWYQRRFAGQGARARRVGIVAVARKLLVALWHYVERGVVPEGAALKPTTC
jgi:transposase